MRSGAWRDKVRAEHVIPVAPGDLTTLPTVHRIADFLHLGHRRPT